MSAARLSAETRVLHFPNDCSTGTVFVVDWGSLETTGYSDGPVLCEATGDMAVPAGKAVRLDLQGCGVTEEGLKRLKKKLPALHWHL